MKAFLIRTEPKINITSTVVSDDAAILKRLLPISIALNASSKCSDTLRATLAPRFPSFASFSRRTLFSDENDISAAEKNAENKTLSTIPAITIYSTIIHRPLPRLPSQGQ